MKWLDTNIRALDRTLEKRPVILKSVRVNLAVNVSLRVIDDAANVFIFHLVIAGMRIGVDARTLFDVFTHSRLKDGSRSRRNDHCADFAMTFEKSHNRDLANHASGRKLGSRLSGFVHVRRFAADER